MDIKIQKKPAFTVAGVLLEAIDNSQCPSAWEQLYANHSFESLESMGSGQSFGLCSDVKEGEIINYMAAYDVTDKAKAEELGLSIKDIPAAEYAIVPVKGPIPASIHNAWKYVLEVFSQKQAIATQERQTLKSILKEICRHQTIKWNSGYQ